MDESSEVQQVQALREQIERLLDRVAEGELIAGANLELAASLNLEESAHALLNLVSQATGATLCHLQVLRDGRPATHYFLPEPISGEGVPAPPDVLADRALVAGRPLLVGGAGPECRDMGAPADLADKGDIRQILAHPTGPALLKRGRCPLAAPQGPCFCLGLPLIAAGRPVGAVTAHRLPVPENVRQQTDLLATLVAPGALAIANAHLYTTMEQERHVLASILASTGDAVLVTDQAGKLRFINPVARTLLVQGQTGEAARREDLDPVVQSLLQEAGSGNQELVQEVLIKSGRVLQASISPLRGDRDIAGHVAVFRDITALRELERARLRAEQEKRERYQQVLRRYVSPPVVELLLKEGVEIGDRPEVREAAVLYADLRGFTGIVGSLAPRTVVEEILNPYFTRMTEVLHRHEGTIDKFIGDAILAYFGVPFRHEDDASRALRAAAEMQQEMGRLNQGWNRLLDRRIEMGIGVAYGEVLVGNVGSQDRSDYTAIGMAINIANRLQELAGPGKVLVEAAVVERLPDEGRQALRPLDPVRVKGCSRPVAIFALPVAVG